MLNTPCWLWWGTLDPDGYGVYCPTVNDRSKRVRAHRLAYETMVGPIAAGLVMDHLCRNRACVNPGHLEPVTSRINTLRGDTFAARNIVKLHCSMGHEYTKENTYEYVRGNGIKRQCRRCCIDRTVARRKGLKAVSTGGM